MKGKDFVPQRDDTFLDWIRNFIAVIVANAVAWLVPAELVSALQAQLTDFESKLAIAKSSNRGKVDVANKNAAKEILKHTARDVTKRFLAWSPAVSDAERELLGITVHDTVRTSIHAPKTRPEFSYKILDLLRLLIDFYDQGSNSRAIPYGYNGAVFFYTIADILVTDYALFDKTLLLTRSPFTLELPPETRGKVLSGAMQWQNAKGEKGPWSEIQSVVIP
jgi:hypothetical protein